jgi:hypothetical protein
MAVRKKKEQPQPIEMFEEKPIEVVPEVIKPPRKPRVTKPKQPLERVEFESNDSEFRHQVLTIIEGSDRVEIQDGVYKIYKLSKDKTIFDPVIEPTKKVKK